MRKVEYNVRHCQDNVTHTRAGRRTTCSRNGKTWDHSYTPLVRIPVWTSAELSLNHSTRDRLFTKRGKVRGVSFQQVSAPGSLPHLHHVWKYKFSEKFMS